MIPSSVRIGSVTALALLTAGSLAIAQSHPEFIPMGPAKGALYRPDAGPAPHVAVLLAHRTANFLPHIATRELSRRGFLVLAVNPRSDNNEAAVEWEDIALDVKAGVEFLRKQPGISRIVLFGHSGGGATMTFYQAVAEKGPAFSRGPNKLVEGDSQRLAGLPPADGLILVDAHPGNPVNVLRALNPAVLDETDGRKIDPELDPFNPANGFNPDGPSKYSEDFRRKYFKAQAARMNRLIDAALARRERIAAGAERFPDSDVVLVVRGAGAGLADLDPGVRYDTRRPRKLLKNDGSIATQIIKDQRPSRGGRGAAERNASFATGARPLTIRSFLSANAVRARDSVEDIDWASTNNSVPNAAKSITIPTLVTAMGAYAFIRDNEIHFELLASRDKDFVVLEGATHDMVPSDPGLFGNCTRNFFDYLARWINERF